MKIQLAIFSVEYCWWLPHRNCLSSWRNGNRRFLHTSSSKYDWPNISPVNRYCSMHFYRNVHWKASLLFSHNCYNTVGTYTNLAAQDGYMTSTEVDTSLPTAVYKQIKSQIQKTLLLMMAIPSVNVCNIPKIQVLQLASPNTISIQHDTFTRTANLEV